MSTMLPLSTQQQNSTASRRIGNANSSSFTQDSINNDDQELAKQKFSFKMAEGDAQDSVDDLNVLTNNVPVINTKKLRYVIHSCSSTSSTYIAE